MSARSEKLAELRAAIEGQVQLQKYYRSFAEPEQRERQCKESDRLRTLAARLTADADRIDTACREWKAMWNAAKDRVVELRTEILELENADKIARLEELAELAAQMQGVE